MSGIIGPISKNLYFSPLVKKISSTPPTKIALVSTVATLSGLGFFRGCKEYYVSEILKHDKTVKFSDGLSCSVFGLIGAFTYINPVFSIFAIYHEYSLAKNWYYGIEDPNLNNGNLFFNLQKSNSENHKV
jgi:hypothetical protein